MRRVFGVFPVAEHSVAESEYLASVALNQLRHRRLVAREAPIDQRTKIAGQETTLRPRAAELPIGTLEGRPGFQSRDAERTDFGEVPDRHLRDRWEPQWTPLSSRDTTRFPCYKVNPRRSSSLGREVS